VNTAEVIAAAKSRLLSKPGAQVEAARVKHVELYKVMGKIFAILSERADPNLSLKCDPHLAEILREHYQGVGHRYHLDRRSWINISLDADVPLDETLRLLDMSYDLVSSSLTRKQRTALSG